LICGSLGAALDEPLQKVLAVGREGHGNAAASEGLIALSAATLEDLPKLIGALGQANPLAANYLRAAIDSMVDREISAGKPLPLSALSTILLDPKAGDQPRSLAFDLIRRAAPQAAEQLIPGFLSDPNVELRRLAVERLIRSAQEADKAGRKEDATLLYSQASSAARDVDQIRSLADTLAKRGQQVDIPKQMGFLMHWEVIGPFDNTGLQGFAKVFPPESEWTADAVYPGKSGEVRWQPLVTSDPYGKVDFNVPYGMLKETVGYARTVFNSGQDQSVEIRLGCKNAWKVWVNGELLFGRDEYHRGQRIDQYILPAKFRVGPNEILVKCCQNEQTQDWTVQWEFQLRVCDATGAAVLAIDRPPTPQPQEARRRPAPAK
jgi:hypothetical protein